MPRLNRGRVRARGGGARRRRHDHRWRPSGARQAVPGDGGEIVFRRFLDVERTTGAIFLMNADGSRDRQLTQPLPGGLDDSPNWAPDGSQDRVQPPAGRRRRRPQAGVLDRQARRQRPQAAARRAAAGRPCCLGFEQQHEPAVLPGRQDDRVRVGGRRRTGGHRLDPVLRRPRDERRRQPPATADELHRGTRPTPRTSGPSPGRRTASTCSSRGSCRSSASRRTASRCSSSRRTARAPAAGHAVGAAGGRPRRLVLGRATDRVPDDPARRRRRRHLHDPARRNRPAPAHALPARRSGWANSGSRPTRSGSCSPGAGPTTAATCS